jgi:hypothetical protein
LRVVFVQVTGGDMKRIIRALYAGNLAVLADAQDAHVQSALAYFVGRLDEELAKPYRWLAACTVAVEAGRWGGERRRLRRVKLLSLVNACRTRLGMATVEPLDSRWAMVGLHYGYGAMGSYGQDHGLSLDITLCIGTLDSHGAAAAGVVADFLRGRQEG